jgi:hypothetical protein
VTVGKLLALAGLGTDNAAVVLSDLVDWFYSYFDFTKIWTRRVVAEAVSNAVAGSRAGYAVGLVRGDGTTEVRDPKLVRIGEVLPGEEIDLSGDAALLEAGYAQRLLDAAHAPDGARPEDWHAETAGPGAPELAATEEPTRTPGTTVSQPPPGKRADRVGRVEVKATVGKAGFFDLNRVLSWLRDNAREVQVEISIEATAPDEGLDRVDLRNGVIEPLEESGAHVEITLG